MKYRVNYGNGQVSSMMSKAECKRLIASMDLYRELAFIQFRDAETGEWFRAR